VIKYTVPFMPKLVLDGPSDKRWSGLPVGTNHRGHSAPIEGKLKTSDSLIVACGITFRKLGPSPKSCELMTLSGPFCKP
jgi:hypothetical protein